MKKIKTVLPAVFIFFVLLGISFVCCADYDVAKFDFSAAASEDGSVSVNEDWTVDFADGNDSFDYQIDISDDYGSEDISDVSVGLDSTVLEEESSGGAPNTFTSYKRGSSFFITVYSESLSGRHNISIRYTVKNAAVNYDGDAVLRLYIGSVNSSRVIRNITGELKFPSEVNERLVTVIDAGNLTSKKSGSGMEFSSDNDAGRIPVVIKTPLSLFPSVSAAKNSGKSDAATVLLAISAALVLIFLIYLIFSKKIFVARYKKLANRIAAPSYESLDETFHKYSPSEVIKFVSDDCLPADAVIASLLDLIMRGHLAMTDSKLCVSSGRKDKYERNISRFERDVIEFFTRPDIDKIIMRPEKFADEINRLYYEIPDAGVFSAVNPVNKDYVRFFFIYLESFSRNLPDPGFVSDEIFKNDRFNATDIVMSVISSFSKNKNEYYRPKKEYENDMFLLRNAYLNGEKKRKTVGAQNRRKNKTRVGKK